AHDRIPPEADKRVRHRPDGRLPPQVDRFLLPVRELHRPQPVGVQREVGPGRGGPPTPSSERYSARAGWLHAPSQPLTPEAIQFLRHLVRGLPSLLRATGTLGLMTAQSIKKSLKRFPTRAARPANADGFKDNAPAAGLGPSVQAR